MVKGDVIAMDIGGTNMRCALVRGKKILKMEVKPTPKTKGAFLKQLCLMIDEYNSAKVKGIGIGIAGPVFGGKVLDTPNIALKKFDLKKFVQSKYKKKVAVENDARCFTLAELKLGQRSKNFIMIAIGTGIGGGIVLNGELVRGRGYVGEFGKMRIGKNCWEEEWGKIKKIVRKEYGKEKLFSDLLKKRTKKGDLILNDAAKIIALGVSSIDNAFDPDIFYLGGGIKESGNAFLKMIQKEYEKQIFFNNKKKIKWGSIKNEGLIGASLLV